MAQLGAAYNSMSSDMRMKLGGYMTSLERRYGDPAAYAAQRAEMAAEQASVMYAEAKTREQALSAAYGKNRESIRQAHVARMANRSRATNQRLVPHLQQSQTPAPRDESAPLPASKTPGPLESAAD